MMQIIDQDAYVNAEGKAVRRIVCPVADGKRAWVTVAVVDSPQGGEAIGAVARALRELADHIESEEPLTWGTPWGSRRW
jgi:hypothetical protein